MMSVTLLPSAPPRQMWCKGVRTMNHWRWLNQSILLLQGDAATHPVGCNIPVRSIDFCRLSGSSLLTFKDQRLITQHMVLETSTNILHNPSNTRNSRHPESAKVKKRLLFFFGFFFCQNSLTRLQMTLTEKPTESKSIVRNIASPAQSECNIKTTLQSEISLFFVVVFFPFFSPHNFLATSKSWHSGLYSQNLAAGFYCITVGQAKTTCLKSWVQDVMELRWPSLVIIDISDQLTLSINTANNQWQA